MGLFSRMLGKPTVVRVVFRELTSPVPQDSDRWYAYTWPLRADATPGTRVMVPGSSGLAPAVVVGTGTAKDGIGHALKPVARLVTEAEIERAHAREAEALAKWLRMGRKAAGLSGAGRVAATPPDGYPPIPPASGEATPQEAGEYGRVWYRLAKHAEEAGRDRDEISAFNSIAYRWYAIRDRG